MRPPVGIRFPSPMAQSMGMENRDVLPVTRAVRGPSPYRDFLEGAQTGMGLEALAPTPADTSVLRERAQSIISGLRPPEAAPPELKPQIAYSPSTGMFAVNDFVFNERDYANALESEKYLNSPAPIPGNVAQDWQRVNPEEYAALLEGIRNPTLGTRFSRSFESGMSGMGVATGAGLQVLGAEGIGGSMVRAGQQRQQQLAPFTPEFSDVLKGEEQLTDWFVSAIGSAGPSILESIASAGVGAGIGAATSGPVGAGAGVVAGFFGKQAVKKTLLELAKKKAAGVALSAAEKKTLSTAAKIAGATTVAYLDNARLLTGETYNEMRNAGVDPQDLSAKLLAVGAGNLGAIPEIFVEGKLVLDVLSPKRLAPTTLRKGVGRFFVVPGKMAGRIATGAGAYGLAEGATEAIQSGLTMGATKLAAGEKYTPDALENFINSFAAGFAVGAPLGGMAGMRYNTAKGEPTDLTQNPGSVAPAQVDLTQPTVDLTQPTVGTGSEEQGLYPTDIGSLSRYSENPQIPVGGQEELFPASMDLGVRPGTQYNLFDNLPEYPVTPEQSVEGQGDLFQTPQEIPPGMRTLVGLPRERQQLELPLTGGVAQLSFPFPTAEIPAGQRSLIRPLPEQQAPEPTREGPRPFRDLFKRANIENQARIDREAELATVREQEATIKNQAKELGAQTKTVQAAVNRKQLGAVIDDLVVKMTIDGAQADTLRNMLNAPPRSMNLSTIKTAITEAIKAKKSQLMTAAQQIQAEKDRLGGTPPKPGDVLKRGSQSAPGKKSESSKKEPAREIAKRGPEEVAVEEQAAPDKPTGRKRRAKKPTTAKAAPENQRVPEEAAVVQDQVEIATGAETVLDKEVAEIVDSQTPNALTADLASMLEYAIKYWNDPTYRAQRAIYIDDMEFLFKGSDTNKDFSILNGKYKVKDLFNKDGRLNTVKVREANAAQTEATTPEGKFVRTDGSPITEPIASGKLKLLVGTIVSKFSRKPAVSVIANVEELKRTNRALYNRAIKARPDLDTVAASGVSFGDQIVLFSDNIRTEQEAKFVLAHEALGHFGLRSIMTQEELNTALDDIYENSDNIRYTAQRKMGLYKISKREATEEALSDLAATIDTNTLYRIWSYIKTALTKITGIKFGDEEARRLVWQARRYVRNGNAGVTTAEVVQDGAKEMAAEYDVGMYNRMGAGHAKADIIAAFYPSSETSSSDLLNRAKDVFANAKDLKRWISKGIEQLATADEKTLRSRGYQKAMELYTASARVRQQILTELEKLTKFTNEGSVSQTDRTAAERLLAFANDYARTQNGKREYQKLGNLIKIDPTTGETTVDKAVLDALKKLGHISLDLAKAGFVAEDVDGVNIKHEPLPDLEETSPVWKIYNEQRNAVDFMALELLRSVYKEQYNKFNVRLDKIDKLAKTSLTDKDIYVLKRVSMDYLDIYNTNSKVTNGQYTTDPKSTKRAEEFIVEVLKILHSDDKVNDWKSGNPDEIAGQYQDEKYKYIIEAAPRLRSLGISKQKQVDVLLPMFQNMALDNVRVREAELRAKDTIALGYTPRVRRGKFYVRAVPVDANGKRVFLKSEFEHIIPFSRAESRADREDLVAKLTEAFGDRTYTIPDIEDNEVPVRWKIESGEGNTSASTTEEESPVTLVRQLERYNISLDQQERERLIDAIASFNSAARRSLYRTNNPGWDKNTIQNIAEWAQTFSNIAGKNEYAFLISDVLDNTKLWDGDPELLRTLYKELKDAQATGNQAKIRIASDKFEQYAHQYIVSAPISSEPIKLGDKVYQGQGQGRRYQEDMKEVLRWFSRSSDAVISTEDVLGEKGSALMAGASIMQLGGNISTAAASLTSLPTHSFSYLAFRNQKRGYGGGFGAAKTMAELSRAIVNVTDGLRPNRFTDIKFMEDMVAKGTHADHGLTADEAVFLLDSLSDGTTLAAQANALMDQSVGKIGNNLVRKSVNYWMYMFVATDALNRRVTALAAYRMYKDRIIAANNNPNAFSAKDIAALQADPDYKYAADNAKLAVTKSQGEHGAFNRPKIARGTILRYPFMYQQIVVLTIQLMRNLPPAGQLYILSMIWLMSGLKGVPGEDDFADLFDTLMQFFNVKWEGVDKYLIDMSESILPGSSPFIMRGLVDQVLGGSFSIKTGFGDVLPLTGVFRAGADPARELENFAGPVWAAYAGLAGTGTSTIKWAGSSLGMGDKEVTLLDILRDSPISGLKAVADGLVYLDTGKVINSRGEVLSEEVTASVIASRMLGFYPAEATLNYDVLRMSRNLSEYSKAIKAEYVLKYKRAKAYGDSDRVRSIIEDVRDWNTSARGTPFEIRNFTQSAERAYREAQKPVAARFLRTVSKTNQQTTEDLMTAMGID